MAKIYFQGTFGAYSHLAALAVDPDAEITPCKTFDDCFNKAILEPDCKIIIPESNRITGNIGIYCYSTETLKKFVQLNQSINEIENRLEQLRALENNIVEHIRADTAGSAEMISKTKDIKQAAIASSLSAQIYGLDVVKKNIENESGNFTRFLVMGKNISQPEFGDNKYITSFLFKLKSKPAALYQSLGGFAINGVNLTKLQSYPEKNTFDSFFFLCDLDGHIEDIKVQKSLEELGLHCEDFHVLGVFEADKLREKKN